MTKFSRLQHLRANVDNLEDDEILEMEQLEARERPRAWKPLKQMIVDSARAWTEWVLPTPRRYLMGCCDCGLIHEMEFRVVKGRAKGGGWFVYDDEPIQDTEQFRVQFRARRKDNLTAKREAAGA